MKTISKLLMIVATASALLAGCATRAGFVVRERPVEPVYARPAAPYAGAVWIPGEWEWRGNHYVFINGHYERARNRQWVPGHWREAAGGYVWIRGHWA